MTAKARNAKQRTALVAGLKRINEIVDYCRWHFLGTGRQQVGKVFDPKLIGTSSAWRDRRPDEYPEQSADSWLLVRGQLLSTRTLLDELIRHCDANLDRLSNEEQK